MKPDVTGNEIGAACEYPGQTVPVFRPAFQGESRIEEKWNPRTPRDVYQHGPSGEYATSSPSTKAAKRSRVSRPARPAHDLAVAAGPPGSRARAVSGPGWPVVPNSDAPCTRSPRPS